MNILWITNIVLPEAQSLLKGGGVLKGSGGWMIGAVEALMKQNESINLSIATVSHDVSKLTCLKGEKINYWLLPFGKGNTKVNHDYEPLWREVRDVVKPDVVHLHGTEFSHGLAYLEACSSEHVCVSIQGLTSAIYHYSYYGLSREEIIKSLTIGSLYRGGIMKDHRILRNRADSEIEIIRRVNHIIGRTSWDRAHTWAINPDAEYHYCGETFRSDFYTGRTWEYTKCLPHSIFLSQAGKPIKGLHMLLRAMPLVLRHYPDATIRVAGIDITDCSTWKRRLMLNDFGNIIRKLIRNNGLKGKITFTGQLDSEGMRNEYLHSNVFLCPSSIENSPNSLGEAQLLGVPVIASYVGGIPDMMKGDENHNYRFEDVEMLAYKIVELFGKKGNLQTEPMRQEALRRHDSDANAKELLEIYKIVKRQQ